jgi:large subunit ribosomal protein L23
MNILKKFTAKKQESGPSSRKQETATGAGTGHGRVRQTFIALRERKSEKAEMLKAKRQYVFLVPPHATKPMIRQAVSERYHVSARDVNIVRHYKRSRQFRGKKGIRPLIKKAIVSLREGERIEMG